MAIQIIPNFRKVHKEILQEPDKALREVSTRVDKIDDDTFQIAEELIEILKKLDKPYKLWLGMAAPQIGYGKRIIAIKNSFHEYLVMINPEVVDRKLVLPAISGCYSLKGIYLIKSPYWIKIKYMDLNNTYHTKIFKGGRSILLKQEIDHLNGKLICD